MQKSYELFIGDRLFSSWSLRGWLMFEAFGLPHRDHAVGLYSGGVGAALAGLGSARTVPVMRTPDGWLLTDSLAIAETLHELHPDAGLWPQDGSARALARSMVAEMHAGFGALRRDCPMMLAHAWSGFTPSEAVRSDVLRIERLWSRARMRYGAGGRWLFGRYSLADVFFAPVAMRIATYALPVGDTARAYTAAHLCDRRVRQWRAEGLTQRYDPMPYRLDLPSAPWPGPAPRPARAIKAGVPENDRCPFSGKPVKSLLKIDGRTLGFCNPACRDKVAADPDAWPEVRRLLRARSADRPAEPVGA